MPPPEYKPKKIPQFPGQKLRKPNGATSRHRAECCALAIVIILGIFGFLFFLACAGGFISDSLQIGFGKRIQARAIEEVRAIASAMNAYAADHKGTYPEGTTSTEVFQKLIDGKYVTDPGIFYLEMPGKSEATSGKLTADNVSYDVTGGITADSSDDLPMVFCTGYTIDYSSAGSAYRVIGGVTPFQSLTRNDTGVSDTASGLAVAYKGKEARFMASNTRDGDVYFFVPTAFNPRGKTYRQLRP